MEEVITRRMISLTPQREIFVPLFRAFSAVVKDHWLPGALPQAVACRALGAGPVC